MKKFIKEMKALSDPNRVKIMKMLQIRPLCVCEITDALGIAQSTASKHLKILEDAELVRSVKDGLWVDYTISDGADSPYASTMIGNLKHWLDDDPEIAGLKKEFPALIAMTLWEERTHYQLIIATLVQFNHKKLKGVMMEIKVLGPGCPKCAKAEKLVKEVVDEMGVDASVEKITDMMQIAGYGVFGTPSVIVDGEVKCTGKVPKKDDIKSWLTK